MGGVDITFFFFCIFSENIWKCPAPCLFDKMFACSSAQFCAEFFDEGISCKFEKDISFVPLDISTFLLVYFSQEKFYVLQSLGLIWDNFLFLALAGRLKLKQKSQFFKG